MITIRRSFLEDFRCVVATDYGDEQALIDAIRGQPHPVSWQAEAGTAWHALLADPLCLEGGQLGDWLEEGGFAYRAQDVDRAKVHLGPGLWEVPGSTLFQVRGLPVRVIGTADHLRGLVLQDNKTKFSPADPRDYENSLQWRFYLLIHQASVFRYNLFAMTDPKDGRCTLKDILSFRFWPYQGLEAECRSWVREFVEWADAHRLLPFLQTEMVAA